MLLCDLYPRGICPQQHEAFIYFPALVFVGYGSDHKKRISFLQWIIQKKEKEIISFAMISIQIKHCHTQPRHLNVRNVPVFSFFLNSFHFILIVFFWRGGGQFTPWLSKSYFLLTLYILSVQEVMTYFIL